MNWWKGGRQRVLQNAWIFVLKPRKVDLYNVFLAFFWCRRRMGTNDYWVYRRLHYYFTIWKESGMLNEILKKLVVKSRFESCSVVAFCWQICRNYCAWMLHFIAGYVKFLLRMVWSCFLTFLLKIPQHRQLKKLHKWIWSKILLN